MAMAPNNHSVSAHWTGDFDDAALQAWVEQLRTRLQTPEVTLGLVFTTPRHFRHAEQILEIVRVHGRVPLVAGCSSQNLIAGEQEIEEDAGIALGLYHLPGAKLKGLHFEQRQVEEANGPGYWHLETGIDAEGTNGWLTFVDPFHIDSESWLSGWNEAYPSLPVLGGLSSGNLPEQRTQVYLNGDVFEEGGVGISFAGNIALEGVISQGCTPIGEPWTITRAEGNLIQQIGNRPAYQVLVETFNALPREQQKRAQGNLFVGLVIDEYQEEFHRGDFLIRNLLGGDPSSGVLAVGARPRAGQSVQFQCRDAAAANEDMAELLQRASGELGKRTIYGGCLCSCNGRGQRLFGKPHHDAGLAQKHFGPLGLTGFFCNGEIGPIGSRNFLHGYTASLALFVQK